MIDLHVRCDVIVLSMCLFLKMSYLYQTNHLKLEYNFAGGNISHE
jgi:hypothetical protein